MNANLLPTATPDCPWSALSLAEIEADISTLAEPAYRARQLRRALDVNGLMSWDDATDLPASLRLRLADRRPLRSLSLAESHTSRLDGSVKLLLEDASHGLIESVLMFSGKHGAGRATVCVSSQIGCPAACTFCASGLGFTRNLTSAEITDQVAHLASVAKQRGRRIDNIVFMGMGEPFLNYDRVMEAIRRLRDSSGFGFGARHITVSTVGITPGILKFAGDAGEVNLAISLHAPNDELRSRLVPYNRRFPIADILAAARSYCDRTGRRVSFEYVLLEGTNDTVTLAGDLARLLKKLNPLVHVNLIPWNPFPEAEFSRATRDRSERFASTVRDGGVNATVRYSKGLDIDAACGQLRRQAELEALAS